MDRQYIEQEKRYKRLMKESTVCMYASAALVLNRTHGFEYDEIAQMLEDVGTLWNEFSPSDIVKMCSDETGIDIVSEMTAKERNITGDKYVKGGPKD